MIKLKTKGCVVVACVTLGIIPSARTANAAGSTTCGTNLYCISANLQTTGAGGSGQTTGLTAWTTSYATSGIGLHDQKFSNGAVVGGAVSSIRNRNNISRGTMCIYNTEPGGVNLTLQRQAYYTDYWLTLGAAQKSASWIFIRNTSTNSCLLSYPN